MVLGVCWNKDKFWQGSQACKTRTHFKADIFQPEVTPVFFFPILFFYYFFIFVPQLPLFYLTLHFITVTACVKHIVQPHFILVSPEKQVTEDTKSGLLLSRRSVSLCQWWLHQNKQVTQGRASSPPHRKEWWDGLGIWKKMPKDAHWGIPFGGKEFLRQDRNMPERLCIPYG